MSEIKDIQFQNETVKDNKVDGKHNLLKETNQEIGTNPLHSNDLHMIERNYATELATLTNKKKAREFLNPFFAARNMGFLDAILYKQPYKVITDQGEKSYSFKDHFPYEQLQNYVQSMSGVDDWKTKFVEKVKNYVQDSLVIEPIQKKEPLVQKKEPLVQQTNKQGTTLKDVQKTTSLDTKQELKTNAYGLTSKHGSEQAKKNADYFGTREQTITKELTTELKKQNIELTEDVMNKLGGGVTARWTEQVTQHFQFLESQSSEGLPKSKLVDMVKVSPFDNAAMQKYDMSHDVSIMLKEITSDVNQPKIKDFSADQFHQLLTDYKTIKKIATNTGTQQDKSPKSLDELITSINTKTNISNQKTLQKSLQGFVDEFESARSDSQTESFMNAAMPALEKAGVAISQFGDGINQLFDGLKKSGVWDEIAKIMDLLFGTGSLEDKLKRFNEIKESEMTLNQSWALNKGFDLRETKHKEHEKEPLDKYGISLKKELPDVLFGSDNKWQKSLQDDGKEYEAFKQAFKEQTKWTSSRDPSLENMIVWAHGTPAQKQNIHSGNDVSPDDIPSVIGTKVDTIYKRATDEKRDKSNNPNESFSRALLASLITPPKDSLRVARGVMKADKETKTTLEEQKNAEINMFKESLQLEKKYKRKC